jgi:APA family basic amino acid/polyamine antiporter
MSEEPHRGLARAITGPQFFTLAFGATVGVAWVMILGELMAKAGPGGVALALAVGGVAMLLVAFCYAEIAALRPAAGGELVYAYEVFGCAGAYAVGWSLALVYIATCIFEALSIGVLANMLFPGIVGPTLYTVLDQPVTLGGVGIGLGVTVLLGWLNVMGVSQTVRAQEWATYARLILMVGFVGLAFFLGKAENLQPLFAAPAGQSSVGAFMAVLATTPFWYAGFNLFASATEETAVGTTPKIVGRFVVLAMCAAIAFYCLLALAIGSLAPWRSLTTMELPAANAFKAATGSGAVTLAVLVTAVLGCLTAWNSLLMAGTRVLFALGRAALAPRLFGASHHKYHTPALAIGVSTALTCLCIFAGKGFILPIVNVSSAAFAFTYLVACLAALRLRKTDPDAPRPYRIPGGVPTAWAGVAASLMLLGVSLIQPFVAAGKPPVEWLVLGIWGAVALAIWFASTKSRRSIGEDERRRRLTAAADAVEISA